MRPPAIVVAALFFPTAALGCRTERTPLPERPATGSAAVAASGDLPPCAPPDVRVIGPAASPAEATLVMLHGYGASAAGIEPVARALAGAHPHLVVLVPDGCDPWEGGPVGRQWWGLHRVADADRAANLRTAATRVTRFVDAELARRGLPRDRMAWAGFSQGAILSQWMALHAQPRPLAVVSFSGRFDDDAPVGAPVGTPVLLIHGELDPVLPFSELDKAERALVARGAKVERIARPAMAHVIDPESLAAAVAFLGRNLAAR